MLQLISCWLLRLNKINWLHALPTGGLTSGRTDDQKVAIIKNHIKIYNETTRNVIDYHRAQNKDSGIGGMCSIDEIFERKYLTIDKNNIFLNRN